MAISIGDLSVIFFDANRAGQEENWQDLLAKCPNARRVAVGGAESDAYAAAAVLATSSTFVTLEGDCVVDEEFFSSEIDATLLGPDNILVWPVRNTVNNLCYEHGAIRRWPRKLALSRSGQVPGSDLRWPTTVVASRGYGAHRINASPESAFGHGFHEGVRLSTLNGRRVARGHATRLSSENFRRLLIWMSVGADAENGLWAIFGARLGCKMASLGALDIGAVFEGDWIKSFWTGEVAPQFRGDGMVCEKTVYGWDPAALGEAMGEVSGELQRRLDLPMTDLDPSQSRFFKALERRETGGPRLEVASIAGVLDRLANGHRTGEVAVDTAEAIRLYRLAIAFGSRNAKASLGRMLRDGDHSTLQDAIDLLTGASNEGHALAAYYLGQIFAEGEGVAAEPKRALQYYRLAALRGVGAAMLAAGEMLQAGTTGQTDPIGALAFFQAAEKHGVKVASAKARALSENLSPDELALAERTAPDLAPPG